MLDQARQRTAAYQERLLEAGVELAVLTDESTIGYLGGFWGYLSVEFGRPTFLLVPATGTPTILTPAMESEMVAAMTWVDEVQTWEDSGPRRWEIVLGQALDSFSEIAVEMATWPATVSGWFANNRPGSHLHDAGALLAPMRMIKSPEEIAVMAQAGQIAQAMMAAAHETLAVGVPEFEAALAVVEAGTRKAAEFLSDGGWEQFVSPMIHNLQIMQSGSQTSMVHRRASVKRFALGDPVYFCFCNMAQFKLYKLGFDRMFFVGAPSAEAAAVQQAAIEAQQAAIAAIRPGVTAESIAAAADRVYADRGYETGYRTGRSIGMSYLEAPELKAGDTTVLQPGMTFAVDGGISVDGAHGGRIGDSVVVTDDGCDYLTDYPRELLIVGA